MLGSEQQVPARDRTPLCAVGAPDRARVLDAVAGALGRGARMRLPADSAGPVLRNVRPNHAEICSGGMRYRSHVQAGSGLRPAASTGQIRAHPAQAQAADRNHTAFIAIAPARSCLQVRTRRPLTP